MYMYMFKKISKDCENNNRKAIKITGWVIEQIKNLYLFRPMIKFNYFFIKVYSDTQYEFEYVCRVEFTH